MTDSAKAEESIASDILPPRERSRLLRGLLGTTGVIIAAVGAAALVEIIKPFGIDLSELFPEMGKFIKEKPFSALGILTAFALLAILILFVGLRRERTRSANELKQLEAAASTGQFLPRRLQSWPAAILTLIAQHKNDTFLQKIITDFLYRYADQEASHLRGHDDESPRDASSPQNRIYTSFVSYSELVDAVLRRAEEEGDTIICFATISMPLPQWFNNKPTGPRDFPYVEIEETWSRYLAMMRDLAHGRGQWSKFTLYRIVKVLSDLDEPVGPFMPEADMRKYANSTIVLDRPHHGVPDYMSWEPARNKAQLQSIIDLVRQIPLRKRARALYQDSASANLILPADSTGSDIPGYDRKPLWEAFIDLFSPADNPGDHRAFVRRIGKKELGRTFLKEDGVPNDVFLVGRQKDGGATPEWLFYLAGTTDEGCQMVRLEYGTQQMANLRIRAIKKFADDTMKMIRAGSGGDMLVELSEWARGG